MCCASNARQLQDKLTVTMGSRPGVDCVQVTFTPYLSALREVFSDWRSVVWLYLWRFMCWQMYSFYCNFPLLMMKSNSILQWVNLTIFKGALSVSNLKKWLLQTLQWICIVPFCGRTIVNWKGCKVKRKMCAINNWLSGQYGFLWLEMCYLSFCGIVMSFVFGSFVVVCEPL